MDTLDYDSINFTHMRGGGRAAFEVEPTVRLEPDDLEILSE